jgi:hypothetical protein
MSKEGKEILISFIDSTIAKYDINANETASIIYRGKSEEELEIMKLTELLNRLTGRINQFTTGSATPVMKIKKLKEMREELFQKDNRIFFNTTHDEVIEKVKLVDIKIQQIENEIKEREETVAFLSNICKEIRLQIELESLAV